MGRAVRLYESVDAEIFIVSVGIGTEIAAIGPVAVAVLVFGEKALIHPVPDETALHVV